MKLYPLLFEPNFHTTIWGGRKLQPYKGLESTDEPIGESWEVSAVHTSVSIISNGIWKGRDLVSLIQEFPNEILGKAVNDKYQGKLPLLVKFLDANKDLSSIPMRKWRNAYMVREGRPKCGMSSMRMLIVT